MPPRIEPITTARLDLVSVGLDFISAVLEGRRAEATRLAGVAIPDEWPDFDDVLRIRRAQLEEDPAIQAWLLRLIVIRATGELAGYVNFHGPPGDEGWVEIGYTIEPAHRRRGYATEAALGMWRWAKGRGVTRVRATVSPRNAPSLAMIRGLGFIQTGTQWDEIDGEELVFEADVDRVLQGRDET